MLRKLVTFTAKVLEQINVNTTSTFKQTLSSFWSRNCYWSNEYL